MNKVKRNVVGFLLAAVALVAAGCGTANEQAASGVPDKDDNITVYTSFYPLQYVAERIGGDLVEVKNIVPTGVEPHDFEPTAKDIVDITNADLFVYNGSGFEAWAEKAIEGLDQAKITVVKATDGLELLPAGEEHGEEHEETHEHGTEDHGHGEFDPHVWLDPTLLKAEAEKVKDALVARDQANSQVYEQNYQQLAADLDKLDGEFQQMANGATHKEFLVAHSAFGYLAHRYGLTQIAVSGISPSDEPSPAELKALVDLVKEHQIGYVLFETLASPKVAEVIAREANIQTATLNPLEGLTKEEAEAGKDYLSIMRDNMETLRTVLQ
ncbi:metal ABC transporter substrate-binding protein [Brevibacillus fulvus]|uniref:Zinc transport system substrate-binding protein n=1 Tax=Brevibacillus fulvus TaxID=1125967 RepID=A0A939BW89_9BACL|nr:metal ABC transporter substrate-binding protein [Brevibacillus fulvus]MBM7592189.1 zinc transport system substrate-binding protein [Brevibacillus fulvus]